MTHQAPQILFCAEDELWQDYETPLRAALAETGLGHAVLARDLAPEAVDYIICTPAGAPADFAPFTRLRAVLSLWAGVERLVGNPSLRVPLTRMVDEGLTQGMIEWVTGHVLRHHLGMDAQIKGLNRRWTRAVPPLSADRPVTILGAGALGAACGQALAGLGFPVTLWSRTPRQIDGLTCLHGPDGLPGALRAAEIVVLLLPQTPQTDSLIDAEVLAMMPRGAVLLNPGRGTLIDDDALLAALNAGQIGHATLDVFRVEPLPADHPFWDHARITITPHIASETRPVSAARAVAANIARMERGDAPLHLVDRAQGY